MLTDHTQFVHFGAFSGWGTKRFACVQLKGGAVPWTRDLSFRDLAKYERAARVCTTVRQRMEDAVRFEHGDLHAVYFKCLCVAVTKLGDLGQESKLRSDLTRGLSFLIVFVFAPRRFSQGTPVFRSPKRQRQNFPNSMQSRTVEEEPLCECANTEY